MLDAQLERASKAEAAERERIVRDLARQPTKVMDALVQILHTPNSAYQSLSVQVLKAIGYPDNIRALPTLVSLLNSSDEADNQDIIGVLKDMPPQTLVPELIERLWDRGHHYNWWMDDVRNVCELLLILPSEYAAACGPMIAFVLGHPLHYDWTNVGQAAQDERAVRHDLIRVLQKIGPAAAEYALPALIACTVDEAPSEAGQAAREFLATVDQRLLALYRRIWPWYGRGA